MRKLAAAVAASAVLGAVVANAQQTPPEPLPRAAVPEKESAPAELYGPGQTVAMSGKPVRAGEIVGADPRAILAAARARGDARLLADSYGDPLIEAVAGGRPYDITFYECSENRDCRSIMLRAAFRAKGQTAAEMADWNRGQRFGKAYLDAEGNPIVEMNVNLAGGVTMGNLQSTFDRWQAAIDAFAGHVGY